MKFKCKTIRSCCFLLLFVRFLFAWGGGEGGRECKFVAEFGEGESEGERD